MRLEDRPELSRMATDALRRLVAGKPAFARMLPGARKGIRNARTLRSETARQNALAELRACKAIQRAKNGPFVLPLGYEIAARATSEKEWTPRELKVLREIFPTYGGRAVEYRTGRSLSAVTQKARRLGLVHFEQPAVSAVVEKLEGVSP